MHATAAIANLARRLNLYVASLSLSGAPRIVPIGDSTTQVGPDATLRLSLTDFGGTTAGRYPGVTGAAYYVEQMLTADLFWPDRERGGDSVYARMESADALVDALARLELQVMDYSADPRNPTAVDGAWYRTVNLPSVRDLGTVDGFDRIQITALIGWHMAHADAA